MAPTGKTGTRSFCQVVTFDLICLLKTTDPQTISVSFAISLGCSLKGPHKLIQFLCPATDIQILGISTKIKKTIDNHKATYDHLKKNTFGNREIAIMITTPIPANIN